jgi:hypothetical protein
MVWTLASSQLKLSVNFQCLETKTRLASIHLISGRLTGPTQQNLSLNRVKLSLYLKEIKNINLLKDKLNQFNGVEW